MLSDAERARAIAYRDSMQRAVPISVLVPAALGAALVVGGVGLEPIAILVGAVGWVVAYLARAPIVLLTKDREPGHFAGTWVVAASGPTEELVRLGMLLLLGRDLDTALSVGLGWGAVEVLFTGVQGVALATLMERDDPEAERVRALIPSPPPALQAPEAPWWGLLERAWASVLHLAFSAIIAAQPFLVLLTMLLHSATNLALVRAVEHWSLRRVELVGAVWAAAVAAVAWWLW
jgi:hypothetical protein